MNNRDRIRRLKLTAVALLAGATVVVVPAEASERTDTLQQARESIFNYTSPNLGLSHFTWGAEIGASVDVGGYDMSTFDIDVVFGYKNNIIKTLGLSAGVHRDFHEGTTFIPLEVVFRSSFVSRPSLLFFNLKTGYSFNTVGDSPTTGGLIFNAGVGFNLYRSQRVQSHLLLSYQYIHLDNQQGVMIDKRQNHTDMIQLGIGVNF